jgi:WD40 repeat protein
LVRHTGRVYSVSFSPDGRRIVSGSGDNSVRVWDAETGQTVLGPFEGHTGDVNCVSFSPDGRRIVSGSDDKSIRVWNAETGQMVLGPLVGHTSYVQSVLFSQDGRRIVSGSRDRSLLVWNAETGEMLAAPLVGYGEVLAASISPDGRRIVSGYGDATVRVWDIDPTLSTVRSFINQDAGTVAYHPDSGACLSNLSKYPVHNKGRLGVRPEFRAFTLGSTGDSSWTLPVEEYVDFRQSCHAS